MSRGIYIENEVAYEAAKDAYIKRNATIGRRNRWLAEDPTRHALVARLKAAEETAYQTGRETFASKLAGSLDQWGSLTAGQEAAVRRSFEQDAARATARATKRDEAKAADAATSAHVGEIGKRQQFDLTIRFVVTLEGAYGTSYINICNDAAGNVIVYKGTRCLGEKGATVSVVATIKDHGERDGVRQTIIARPADPK